MENNQSSCKVFICSFLKNILSVDSIVKTLLFTVFTLFSLILTGCGGGGGGSASTSSSTNGGGSGGGGSSGGVEIPSSEIKPTWYSPYGKAQKGPFKKDSHVTMTELNGDLTKTNIVHNALIKNDKGEFDYRWFILS